MIHSKSIINYESYGENDSNFLLMSNFQNLKSLTLSFTNNNFKYLKSISFSKIEAVDLTIYYQPFLLDTSDFVKINRDTLKILDIDGIPDDIECLEDLLNWAIL